MLELLRVYAEMHVGVGEVAGSQLCPPQPSVSSPASFACCHARFSVSTRSWASLITSHTLGSTMRWGALEREFAPDLRRPTMILRLTLPSSLVFRMSAIFEMEPSP